VISSSSSVGMTNARGSDAAAPIPSALPDMAFSFFPAAARLARPVDGTGLTGGWTERGGEPVVASRCRPSAAD
jgi:hypothetical protein